MNVVEIENVRLSVEHHLVLDGISLTLSPGQVMALVGPSGSGKTSILRVVAGLAIPQSGVVRLRGVEVSGDGSCLVPPERRGIGMVFQDLALWPHMSVQQNLLFALRSRGIREHVAVERSDAMLGRVGLRGAGHRAPATLSGGEQQRVALARALVTEPDLLLFDEALVGLDVVLKREMLTLLADLLQERRVAALYVTHEPHEAFTLANQIAVIEAGSVTQIGTPLELTTTPASAFVAELTRSYQQRRG